MTIQLPAMSDKTCAESPRKKRRTKNNCRCSACMDPLVAASEYHHGRKTVAVAAADPIVASGAKAFVLDGFRSGEGGLKRWNILSEELKRDPDIALAALGTKTKFSSRDEVLLENMPESFQNNPSFLTRVLKKKPSFWLSLPAWAKGDVRFVWHIDHFYSKSLITAVLERFPGLCNDRAFWIKLFAEANRKFAPHLFKNHVPSSMCRSRCDDESMCFEHRVLPMGRCFAVWQSIFCEVHRGQNRRTFAVPAALCAIAIS